MSLLSKVREAALCLRAGVVTLPYPASAEPVPPGFRGRPVFDASQGDGGASLPGVPREILERAAKLQIDHGTAYDMPYGTDAYRRCVVEQYWGLEPGLGVGPANVLGAAGEIAQTVGMIWASAA